MSGSFPNYTGGGIGPKRNPLTFSHINRITKATQTVEGMSSGTPSARGVARVGLFAKLVAEEGTIGTYDLWSWEQVGVNAGASDVDDVTGLLKSSDFQDDEGLAVLLGGSAAADQIVHLFELPGFDGKRRYAFVTGASASSTALRIDSASAVSSTRWEYGVTEGVINADGTFTAGTETGTMWNLYESSPYGHGQDLTMTLGTLTPAKLEGVVFGALIKIEDDERIYICDVTNPMEAACAESDTSAVFRPISFSSSSDNEDAPVVNSETLYTSTTADVLVPDGTTYCEIMGSGGGGGGGSGNLATTGAALGGQGGQGGQGGIIVFAINERSWTAGTTTVDVTIGAGGAGGAGKAGNQTASGNDGSAGSDTTVADGTGTIVTFVGGVGGPAGGRNLLLTNGFRGTKAGAGGNAGASSGTVTGNAGGGAYWGGGGGGGGAGVTNGGTTGSGGAGGLGSSDTTSDALGGGGAGGAAATGGSTGSNHTYGGDGGGGGGSGSAASSGAGADGQRGAGGGGSGAYRGTNAGHSTGAGGDGGDGYVRLRFW